MNKGIALGFLAIVTAAVGYLFLLLGSSLDRCVERGGRWHEAEKYCEGPGGVEIPLAASEMSER